jgi:hypothetical protein
VPIINRCCILHMKKIRRFIMAFAPDRSRKLAAKADARRSRRTLARHRDGERCSC